MNVQLPVERLLEFWIFGMLRMNDDDGEIQVLTQRMLALPSVLALFGDRKELLECLREIVFDDSRFHSSKRTVLFCTNASGYARGSATHTLIVRFVVFCCAALQVY